MGKVKRKIRTRNSKSIPHTRRKEKLILLKKYTMTKDDNNMFDLDARRNCIVKVKQRIDFTSRTKGGLSVGQGQARCHSISQDYIAALLKEIMNYSVEYFSEEGIRENTYYMLQSLGETIFCSDTVKNKDNSYKEYSNEIVSIFDIQDKQGLVNLANLLMIILNSALGNLRVGDFRWNSSISYNFDPASWRCVVNDSQGVSWMVNQDTYIPKKMPGKVEEGIYLTDLDDSKRIRNMCQLLDVVETDYPFGIDVYNDKGFYFVGSSSNKYCKIANMKPSLCQNFYIRCGLSWIKL